MIKFQPKIFSPAVFCEWLQRRSAPPPPRTLSTRLAITNRTKDGGIYSAEERVAMLPNLYVGLGTVPIPDITAHLKKTEGDFAGFSTIRCEHLENLALGITKGVRVWREGPNPFPLGTLVLEYLGDPVAPTFVFAEDNFIFGLACRLAGLTDKLPQLHKIFPGESIQLLRLKSSPAEIMRGDPYGSPYPSRSRRFSPAHQKSSIRLPVTREKESKRYFTDPTKILYGELPKPSQIFTPVEVSAVELWPEVFEGTLILRIFGIPAIGKSNVILKVFEVKSSGDFFLDYSEITLRQWLKGNSSRPDFFELWRIITISSPKGRKPRRGIQVSFSEGTPPQQIRTRGARVLESPDGQEYLIVHAKEDKAGLVGYHATIDRGELVPFIPAHKSLEPDQSHPYPIRQQPERIFSLLAFLKGEKALADMPQRPPRRIRIRPSGSVCIPRNPKINYVFPLNNADEPYATVREGGETMEILIGGEVIARRKIRYQPGAIQLETQLKIYRFKQAIISLLGHPFTFPLQYNGDGSPIEYFIQELYEEQTTKGIERGVKIWLTTSEGTKAFELPILILRWSADEEKFVVKSKKGGGAKIQKLPPGERVLIATKKLRRTPYGTVTVGGTAYKISLKGTVPAEARIIKIEGRLAVQIPIEGAAATVRTIGDIPPDFPNEGITVPVDLGEILRARFLGRVVGFPYSFFRRQSFAYIQAEAVNEISAEGQSIIVVYFWAADAEKQRIGDGPIKKMIYIEATGLLEEVRGRRKQKARISRS